MTADPATPVDAPHTSDDREHAANATDALTAPNYSPARLQITGRYPYHSDLPEIEIVWERCSPSVDVFTRLLWILATIPSHVANRPESDQP